MSSPPADRAAPAPERERLPLIFVGIVIVEVATITALYFIGVNFG
jgi:hypothetical protein